MHRRVQGLAVADPVCETASHSLATCPPQRTLPYCRESRNQLHANKLGRFFASGTDTAPSVLRPVEPAHDESAADGREVSMKRELMSVLLGAAMLVPVDAEAQRGRGRGSDDAPRVQKLEPVRRGGRIAPRAARARPYTTRSRVVYRSREGYPRAGRGTRVHGIYRDSWVRVRLDWGRAPRFPVRARLDRSLNPGELRHVLGHQTVNRIRRAGRRMGLRGAPRGHWVDSWRHGLVLIVTMDRVDLAEFFDYDRDGFIDDAYFFRHDRGRRWIGRP